MKEIKGFIPKKPTELHLKVKNLTGDVVAIEDNIVSVDFSVIEDKKVVIKRVDYPLEQCEPHFVKAPIKKHGMTFFQFSEQLRGFEVLRKSKVVPKFMLFWSNVSTAKIFADDGYFETRTTTRPSYD